ncbi:hypothetical protein LCGC14_1900190 [marine sediment metagenome]|uniref:Uncharacterized protein n=1 Tax=marine sediment metagenome TaxID=412755 RepID=A0A0F9FX36_9ZZZZ
MSLSLPSTVATPEVADIFRLHAHKLPFLTTEQNMIIEQITSCRTQALGGHVLRCDHCEYQEISYNSCRNRHCPKCQSLNQARWVEDRKAELLPVPYFHVVFTIPECLNPVALYNKAVMYKLLFQAASETLKEVAVNPKNLGAKVGFIALLHTWDQKLNLHPHIHCIVPGGGLDPEKTRWISSPENYFLPVQILSTVFRGKLLSFLEKAYDSKQISFSGIRENLSDRATFKQLLRTSCSTNWVVYSKPPFSGPERVLRYLGRYTHRIAISNNRILSVTEDSVTFRFKDRKHQNKIRTITLDAVLFMRRFFFHILPKGFVRIRHYGFLGSPTKKEALSLCRELLGENCSNQDSEPAPKNWQEFMQYLTGEDPTLCPICKKGHLIVYEVLVPQKGPPPVEAAA